MADQSPLNPGFERGRGGPPNTRGVVTTPVPRHMIQRIADGARNLWRGVIGMAMSPATTDAGGVPGTPNPPYGPGMSLTPQQQPYGWRALEVRREPWMGPGHPMTPVAPRSDVVGRAFDYQPNRNLGTVARGGERVSFQQLRTLAESFDLVRLAIETRKDQMAKLEFSILPRKKQKNELRSKATDECIRIEEFLRRPDRRHSWDSWLRLLLEDHFVLDAATVYVRRTTGGDVYSLDVVDGSTIIPLLDVTGRQPEPPDPAYQQILRGMPAVNYTADELLYIPRNPRPGKVYGMSPCEQIIMTVNVALRRELAKLQYYTEGNVPEALCSVPKDWTPAQISEFQAMWDAIMSDQAARRKMKFVPGEMAVQFTRDNASLMDTYDEWLARVICYAFSLPALPFIRMQNRATAETAYETAIEEGLQPMMLWVKGLMDRIVQEVFGRSDLEFVWDDIEKITKAERDAANMQKMNQGILSMDEVRAEMGLSPLGMKNAIFGIGPNGLMFIDDLVEAHQQGLLKMQPPPDPMANFGMMGAMPGDPGFIDGEVVPPDAQMPPQAGPQQLAPPVVPAGPAAPGLDEVLAGVDPRLLAAVGLGPGGRAERLVDVRDDEEMESDPLAPHVAHPEILKTLRDFERNHLRR